MQSAQQVMRNNYAPQPLCPKNRISTLIFSPDGELLFRQSISSQIQGNNCFTLMGDHYVNSDINILNFPAESSEALQTVIGFSPEHCSEIVIPKYCPKDQLCDSSEFDLSDHNLFYRIAWLNEEEFKIAIQYLRKNSPTKTVWLSFENFKNNLSRILSPHSHSFINEAYYWIAGSKELPTNSGLIGKYYGTYPFR